MLGWHETGTAALRFANLLTVISAIAIGIQFAAPTRGTAATSCGVPLDADGEWLTSSPEDAGLDAALLCSLNETLDKSPEMNVHAVVIVRGGKLVYEYYRAGEDYKWGKKLGLVTYTPQMQHDVRSISKSVVSLLFGIALDRKLVVSTDEPVLPYFPELAALRSPEKDRVLLRHLLTMTSGLAWDERRDYSDPENSEHKMISSTGPYRFVLEQPVWHKPGEEWNYSSGSTQLLAGVVQRSTGKWLVDFAREALFEPLGITQFEWMKMPTNGEVEAASGLRLRPRDMAKIGELILKKGMWNGRRIISEAWIQESTKGRIAHIDAVDSLRYGYQWWGDEGKVGDRQVSWIIAVGFYCRLVLRIGAVPTSTLLVAALLAAYAGKQFPQLFNGSLMYAPELLLVFCLGLNHLSQERRERYGIVAAAGAFVAALFFRTVDNAVCPVFPLGTHFLWHLLDATALYLATRALISNMPRGSLSGDMRTS